MLNKTEVNTMFLEGIEAELKKRAVSMGIDPDETIYRLCWEDVLNILAHKLAEEDVEPNDISDGELADLLEGGQEAAETLPWYDTLSVGVDDAWNKIRPGQNGDQEIAEHIAYNDWDAHLECSHETAGDNDRLCPKCGQLIGDPDDLPKKDDAE